MRVLFLGIVAILVSNLAWSQLGTLNDKNTAKSFVPASPNVAQIQKYGDIPVNYSSGVPSISIPIWTLNLKDFSWPVSLSYHSIGTQVSEVASNVGLGWTLNATGIVSAKVIGENDLINPNWGNLVRRNLQTGGYKTVGGYCHFYNQDDQQMADLISQGANSFPDLYYINSPLMNSKFFLRDDSGYCMPSKNLKIKYNDNLYIQNASFYVIDEGGNKYYFDSTAANGTVSNCDEGINISVQNHSFYLTNIQTYSGEEIKFFYTPENFSYSTPGSQTTYEKLSQDCHDCDQYYIATNNCTNSSHPKEQRLDSILTSNGESLHFFYSNRTDLPGSSKLDSIKVGFRENGKRVFKLKKVLTTSYFGTGGVATSLRLKLDEIRTEDTGGKSNDKYQFTYDLTSLPDRLSYAVDVYGYYNGANSNSSYLVTQANRFPNAAYAKAGMLTKIEYPTGSYTSFEYEYNYLRGGNRIKRIDDVDNNTNYNTRVFEYSPDGGFNPPLFEEGFLRHYLVTAPNQPVIHCNVGLLENCYGTVICAFKKHTTSPVSHTYDQFATYAKYDTVREFRGTNGEGGYNEYIYDFPKTSAGGYRHSDEIANFEAQLVKKRIFEKEGSSYRVLSEEVSDYEVLNEQLGYFDEAIDPREKNTWGIEVIQQTSEIRGDCFVAGLPPVNIPYCHPATYLQGNFKFVSTPLFLMSQQKIAYAYDGGGVQSSLMTSTNYEYSDFRNNSPTKVQTTRSDGQVVTVESVYPTSYQTYTGLTTDESNALQSMLSANNLGSPFVETTKVGSKVTNKTFLSYKLNGSIAYIHKVRSYPSGGTVFRAITYSEPDSKNNIRQVEDPAGIVTSYIYDDSTTQVTTQVIGAPFNEIASTSFESGTKGNWSYSGTPVTAESPTGRRHYLISSGNSLIKTGLSSAKEYFVSYWSKNGSYTVSGTLLLVQGKTIGAWTYYHHKISGITSTSISGTGAIDEVRLYPCKAQINTYTYEEFTGLSSISDLNNRITYYEYDGFGRMILVRDEDKRIQKRICYNFYGQPDNCNFIPPCDATNCVGVDKKCINGVCETARKQYTSAILFRGSWICTYYWVWSDCSNSIEYTETLPSAPSLGIICL